MPLTEFTADLIGGSLVPRSLCHSVSEPCGSASTSRIGLVALICAARCAARVLLPQPTFRDEKTITSIPLPPDSPQAAKMNHRGNTFSPPGVNLEAEV